MSAAPPPAPDPDDDLPRRSLWASLPKRNLGRAVVLLAILVAVVYLRDRTGAIAGCMANAFLAPPPAPPGERGVRVRLALPPPVDGGENKHP